MEPSLTHGMRTKCQQTDPFAFGTLFAINKVATIQILHSLQWLDALNYTNVCFAIQNTPNISILFST